MPRELIFTSVPSGVNPGSTGYCTVAKHKGIDRLLDQALEEICFYEMMNAAAKPVVHAYRIVHLNTGTFHVLTRISFSGSDHTGRTNYLAHNLIFDQAETYAQTVSPAEIFLNGTGWLSAWPKGAPPAFLNEGTCKVSLPASSSAHSSLQTWANFTGNGNLAHELGGRGQWKFMTQGGDHQSSLSLIAEFASLPGTPNQQLCWSQLTFTTYLQPSDKPEDFKIVSGDASVPAFAALARDTLNLSSPATPGQCFGEAGSSTFGPLPALNQPPEAKVEPPQSVTPTAGQEIAPDPFADDEPEEAVAAADPVQASNLNLGPIDLPTEETGPTDLPSGTRAYRQRAHRTVSIQAPKKSKAPVILFSVAGVSLLAAVVFALIYFWDDLQKPTAEESETAKSDNNEQPSEPGARPGTNPIEESNNTEETNVDSNSQAAKGNQREEEDRLDKLTKILVKPPELEKLEELKRELDNQLKAIAQAKQAIPQDLKKQANDRQNELAGLIAKKDAALKDELAANTPLPEKILLDSGLPSSNFEIIPSGDPGGFSSKAYAWDDTKVIPKGETSFPAAYWVDGNKVYLRKDKTYQIKKANFGKIRNIAEPNYVLNPKEPPPKVPELGVSSQPKRDRLIYISGVGNESTNDAQWKTGTALNGARCQFTYVSQTKEGLYEIRDAANKVIDASRIRSYIVNLKYNSNKPSGAAELNKIENDYRAFLKIHKKEKINAQLIKEKIFDEIRKLDIESTEGETDKLPPNFDTGSVKKGIFDKDGKLYPFNTLKALMRKDKEDGWGNQTKKARTEARKFENEKKRAKNEKAKKEAQGKYDAVVKRIESIEKSKNEFYNKYASSAKYDEFKDQYNESLAKYRTLEQKRLRTLTTDDMTKFRSYIKSLEMLLEAPKPPWLWKEKTGGRIILEVIE
jgi:hypothetical protein